MFLPTITILCEGASEMKYVQAVNRLMIRPERYPIPFKPFCLGNGDLPTIKARLKTFPGKERSSVKVWVDQDLYCQGRKWHIAYSNTKGLQNFLFSCMNFEDFLVTHCSDDAFNEWLKFCNRQNHFLNPMPECTYLPAFQSIFPNYQKGDLPFELTCDRLENMFKHVGKQAGQISNGFGEFLKSEVIAGNLTFLS